MKKIFLVFLIALLSLVLIACAGVANNSTDSNSNDAMQQKVNLPWPKDLLPKSVPQLKGITITEIADIEDGVMITFEGCSANETKLYVNQIKNAGWDFKTSNDESGKTVTASKPNETLIFISSPDTEDGSIAYTTN